MIEISDFAPGIIQTYHPTNPVLGSVNGAAVADGTFGCCADTGGSLVPLPGLAQYQLIPHQATLPFSTAVGMEGIFAMDAILYLRQVWILYALKANFGSGTFTYYLGRRYSIQRDGDITKNSDWWWSRAVPAASVFTTDLTGDPVDLNGNLAIGKSKIHDPPPQDPPELGDVYSHLIFSIPGPPNLFLDLTIPAAELLFTDFNILYGTQYPSPAQGLFVLPDPDAVPTFITQSIATEESAWVTFCYGHRNRTLGVMRNTSPLIAGVAPYSNPLLYTQAGDVGSGVTSVFHFSDENDSQISWLISTSGEELLAIRRSGGGVGVRGDLDEPTIYRYPFLESTYNTTTIPTYTPLGVMYATINGIFMWEGSETSSKVSNQLDGAFWITDSMTENLWYRGRMAWWHPWVMCPNNFMFDSRSSSWWRLANPETHGQYNVYVVTDDNVLVAFPDHARNVTNSLPDQLLAKSIQTFVPGQLADTYEWKSHALLETIDRTLQFQSIYLTYSPDPSAPASKVEITLSGYNNDNVPVNSATSIFTTDNATDHGGFVVEAKTIQPSFIGRHVQLQLKATSTGGGSAPRIHRIQIITQAHSGHQMKT